MGRNDSVGTKDVDWLEQEIDRLNEDLEPLKEFILRVVESFHILSSSKDCLPKGRRESMFLLETEEDLGVLTYLNRLTTSLCWVDGLPKLVKNQRHVKTHKNQA